MQEKENIVRILEDSKKAIREEDVIKLKELSNQTIHTASITQDPDNIAIAVIVYSLSKIIERGYNRHSKWSKNTISRINDLAISLKEENEKKFKHKLGLLRSSINNISNNLKVYIQDVFRKASINKASRIYEHGISMEKTASLLGITMFELAGYAGQTGISDIPLSKTMDTKARIKIAREIFE